MQITEDRKDLFEAISAAQGEFTTVEKNAKNPHFNSKFAPLDSIIEMIRPILPRHGLSVMQHCDIPESGNGILIETVITHKSGQYISGRLSMPAVKQDPQGYGSAITYARRYALGAALGIVSDEDVDGNQGDGKPERQQRQQKPQETPKSAPQQGNDPSLISEAQRKLIFAKMKEKGLAPETLKEAFKVESSQQIKRAQMEDVLAWIDGQAQA